MLFSIKIKKINVCDNDRDKQKYGLLSTTRSTQVFCELNTVRSVQSIIGKHTTSEGKPNDACVAVFIYSIMPCVIT